MACAFVAPLPMNLPVKCARAGSIFEMVTQVIELQLGASEKYCIGRLCGLVDEANSAVACEALDFHFKCRLVGSFPRDFSSFLRHFFGRRRLGLLMQVIGIEAGKTKIADQNLLNVRARTRSNPALKAIPFGRTVGIFPRSA